MKINSTIVIVVSIAAVFVLFGFVYWYGQQFVPLLADPLTTSPEEVHASIGKNAPYFDLPNTKGDHVRLSDFIDGPVVIVFWATWESAATDQIQILDSYIAEHKNNELAKIIIINSQEEKSIVSAFLRRGGYQVETLYDMSGGVTDAYEARSLPTTFFIDRDGIIRSIFTGVMSKKTLGDKIELIL